MTRISALWRLLLNNPRNHNKWPRGVLIATCVLTLLPWLLFVAQIGLPLQKVRRFASTVHYAGLCLWVAAVCVVSFALVGFIRQKNAGRAMLFVFLLIGIAYLALLWRTLNYGLINPPP